VTSQSPIVPPERARARTSPPTLSRLRGACGGVLSGPKERQVRVRPARIILILQAGVRAESFVRQLWRLRPPSFATKTPAHVRTRIEGAAAKPRNVLVPHMPLKINGLTSVSTAFSIQPDMPMEYPDDN
jgi:hypothetical protein